MGNSELHITEEQLILMSQEGSETAEELLIKNEERCVRLPMMGEIRSLNLSNTVCVAVYEVLRQWDYPELQNFGELHNFKWDEI